MTVTEKVGEPKGLYIEARRAKWTGEDPPSGSKSINCDSYIHGSKRFVWAGPPKRQLEVEGKSDH